MNTRKDPLENYLDSSTRLNFSNFPGNEEEPPNEIPTQALTNSLKHITSTLISFGFPPLGNLLSPDHSEVQKTITCIYSLLQQRQKDMNFRSEVSDKLRSLESEKSKLQTQLEKSQESKTSLESELGKLQNSIKNLTSKSKQEKDKLLSERDELKRENIKLSNKESQCLHELKKKDAAYAKLQDQLRKTLGEKDLPIRNSIEITGPLHTTGPSLFGKNGDSEFSYMISRGFEENQNALLLENKELRTSLDLLQNELLDMLHQRKEAFQKRYSAELGDEVPDFSEFKIAPLKKDLFNLPYQGLSEEVVKTFQENMRVYQRFLDKADEVALEVDGEGEDQLGKIKCVADLKELLSKNYLENYRVLLKNQEIMMQNSVLGSKTKAPDSVGLHASRLKVISDNEIEKANRFLQDEFKKLEAKQQEIEEHRVFVSETAHRLDEEKILVSVKVK
jgi:X breakpoint 2-interacting protein